MKGNNAGPPWCVKLSRHCVTDLIRCVHVSHYIFLSFLQNQIRPQNCSTSQKFIQLSNRQTFRWLMRCCDLKLNVKERPIWQKFFPILKLVSNSGLKLGLICTVSARFKVRVTWQIFSVANVTGKGNQTLVCHVDHIFPWSVSSTRCLCNSR